MSRNQTYQNNYLKLKCSSEVLTMFLLRVLISCVIIGAARVNLSLARCKNSEIIYLQPTDHVVVKACTVNVAMIAEEESLRSPEETSGMIALQKCIIFLQ